ncbi:MAG: tRNA uridine-5-carboxymethylaminomethyl(34) synthesis GTPase MnmE [Cryobacterium sp.]|nr:tRNA uridine-5-carboxymethylaminomethyl(34) synthesis GTPase MnmE [Oligoflexia bacterium]
MSSAQYLSHDTIHALATPPGGALAIVRISGPRSREILDRITRGGSAAQAPRFFFRSKMWDPKATEERTALIDDGMAVYFENPKSHTGEEAAELFIHGGSAVAERLLEALSGLGSRQALAGEFSFRAVRNGKTSITAAQAVADLIAAKNAGAATLALEKMEGSQAKLITELAEGLRKLVTLAEIGIDFADQDVEELSLPVLKKRTQNILKRLEELESSFDRGRKIQDGIKAAFIGRPNAGKSSYFNALLGEERSIVSDQAGTTRDVVRESLTLRQGGRSITLRLEDTAGIRARTDDAIERIGMDRSLRAASECDFIAFIVEAGESSEEWEQSLAVWSAVGKPSEKTMVILTKTDRISPDGVQESRRKVADLGVQRIYPVSVVDSNGIRDSVRGIIEFGIPLVERAPGEVLLTRLDHLQAVRDAQEHLERAFAAPGEDFFASDLRQALNALGPVIGETLPDDILGRIFSEFCIGK